MKRFMYVIFMNWRTFPFEKVDYVFTTVHISSYVPVPILEIGSFLQDNDIDRVRKLFARESKDFCRNILRRNIFYGCGRKDEG